MMAAWQELAWTNWLKVVGVPRVALRPQMRTLQRRRVGRASREARPKRHRRFVRPSCSNLFAQRDESQRGKKDFRCYPSRGQASILNKLQQRRQLFFRNLFLLALIIDVEQIHRRLCDVTVRNHTCAAAFPLPLRCNGEANIIAIVPERVTLLRIFDEAFQQRAKVSG